MESGVDGVMLYDPAWGALVTHREFGYSLNLHKQVAASSRIMGESCWSIFAARQR